MQLTSLPERLRQYMLRKIACVALGMITFFSGFALVRLTQYVSDLRTASSDEVEILTMVVRTKGSGLRI